LIDPLQCGGSLGRGILLWVSRYVSLDDLGPVQLLLSLLELFGN